MFETMAGCGGGDGDRLARSVASLDPAQVTVVADLAEALAGDPRSRTAGELTDQVRSLDRLHAVLDSATLATWSAWEDTMAYTDDGHAAPGSWINANLCVRAGVARYQVGLARKLRSGFPHVGAAAAAGRLGRTKVELLVKARAEDIADVFDTEEAQLVEEVVVRTVEAADVFLASWRLEVLERLRQNDKDAPLPPESEASTLQLSPILDDRMMFCGELSPPDAALLTKAIDDRIDQWYTAGLLTNDERNRRQLQAAALIELVKDGTAPASRNNGARPLTLALIDADTLTARAAASYRAWLEQFMQSSGISWPEGAPDPGPGPTRTPPNRPSAGQPAGRSARVGERGSTGPGRRRGSTARASRPDRPPDPDLFGTTFGADHVRPDPSSPHTCEASGPCTGDSIESTLRDLRDHLGDLTRFAATSPTAQQMRFRSELIGAGPVDPAIIEELICNGELVPVLHRNHTEILDMGRAVRLATAAQRKALLVRSGGTCEWPGCSIPHGWCDAHHLHFWEDQGPTDLDNLALVCNHHHKRFHRAGYTGVVTPTGLDVHRPDGTPIQPTLSGRV